MLGRWVSDLEVGDVLGPVDRERTPFLVHEYAHAVEDSSERHQGHRDLLSPPTIVHTDKKCLLDHSCPEGGGPTARLHLIYDATHHGPVPGGRLLSVSGEVTDRYLHKGRDHLVIVFEVRDKVTGEIYTTYRDTTLMGYQPKA
jgi:hypothetical protein